MVVFEVMEWFPLDPAQQVDRMLEAVKVGMVVPLGCFDDGRTHFED